MQKIYLCLAGRMWTCIKLMFVLVFMVLGEKGFGQTLNTDYFRSANNTGNDFWDKINNWESSSDNINWFQASAIPTSAANTITIKTGFNIEIKTGSQTASHVIIEPGATLTFSNGSFTLFNRAGAVDMELLGTNSNFVISSNSDPVFNPGSKVRINSNAKILLSGNINIALFHSSQFIYADASNFEYSNTNAPEIQTTFFQNQDANSVPLFIYNSPVSSQLGSGNAATNINGKLEVSAGRTMNVSGVGGTLTVRNGIIGAGDYVDVTSKVTNITGATAEIGGTGKLGSYITIANGSTTTLTSNKSYLASKFFIVNGIYDFGTNIMSTPPGGSTMTVGTTGILRTANVNGLTGAGSIATNITLSALPTGSTVEYYSNIANQIVTNRPDYFNLILSGAFTKTPAGTFSPLGTVSILNAAIFDCSGKNIGDANTSLFMTGGRLIVSTGGTQPSMENTYTLSAGVVQFNGASAETIRTKTYQNIEVTGVGVGNSSGNITLNNGGTFTVKSTGIFEINSDAIVGPTGTQTVTVETRGTFKTGDVNGFAGGTGSVATSVRNDIENVVLQPGSTVEYSKATGAGQIITNEGVTSPIIGNYYNLTLSGNGLKTAPSSTVSILGNLTKSSTCIFAHNSGTVSINGISAVTQIYTSTVPVMEFCKLTNNNTIGGFTINSDLGVDSLLTLSDNSKLIFGTGNINIRSNSTRTGSVGKMIPSTASSIDYTNSGRFIIERYLYSRKAWRLLATPVEASSLSITDSWREGVGGNTTKTSTGYGTQITGPSPSSIGMDEPTLRASMKWYNKASNKYVEILNTADAIARPQGYYLFVRGDRAQNSVGAGGATNLRIRGKILTGDQTFTTLKPSSPNDGFESVGNPYPSQINYKTVDKSNLEASFTVWDPTAGIYGVGRFIQYTSTTGLNGNYSNGGLIVNTIESGQAFFIQTAVGVSGSITIKESDKLAGSNLVSRNETQDRYGVYVPTLEINLHDTGSNATRTFLDHVVLNFDSNYNNEFDGKDVRKFMNANDNLAIKNGTRDLILERRKNLSIRDTIFLSITNTKVAPYRFIIDPSALGNLPLMAYLKDKFLQTETVVSLTDVTNIYFSVTDDAASKTADRFMIVFKTAIASGQFTGNFISIAVEKNSNKTSMLKWSYSNELNIAQYSIERSNNGTVFTGIGNLNAGNLSNIGSYKFTDSLNVFGTNYYRIKATSTIGLVQYSAVVKVVENDPKPLFVVQPNPVVNKTLHINFEKLQGDFNLRLIAKQGETVFSKQITISSAKEVKNIVLGDAVASGVYELVLVDSTGMKLLQTIFIK